MWPFLTDVPLCTFTVPNFFLHSRIYWVWGYIYLHAVTVVIFPPHSQLHEIKIFTVHTWYHLQYLEECSACSRFPLGMCCSAKMNIVIVPQKEN